jgi:protein TonB
MLLLASFTWETPRMSINLIESEHRTEKSLRSTFVSVAVHACIISLAVYASANAAEVRVTSPTDTVTVFYPQTAAEPSDGPSRPIERRAPRDPGRVPGLPRSPITLSNDVPLSLPPIDSNPFVIDDGHELFGSSTQNDGPASGPKVECFADCGRIPYAYPANEVEKPAMPRNGNPSPKYPSLLESSRVEGAVLVQFVVDTLGVADMSTFKVLDATNDLFAESTRATLSKWRFYPAEAGGRKVKQIVQLPLKFVAPHR